ncbi:hypothetical protein ZIOFF_002684 [Zingiber officinale]|uniref:Uncharacterized protein n=1 Tax=Zingiber officinale TaxID=94328 RepID=A0A8J5IM83_ZINOF|nr:hypothetical protein ZIOFF_002684 [Zingiber officinale]
MTGSKADKIMVVDNAGMEVTSTAAVEVASTAGVEPLNTIEMKLANTVERELANTAEVEVLNDTHSPPETANGKVVAESAFSTGGRVIYNYIASLGVEIVQVLLYGEDWFHHLYGIKTKKKDHKEDVKEYNLS